MVTPLIFQVSLSIRRVEQNKRLYMRSDHLARLVKALGVSADELLGTAPDNGR